MSLHTEKNDGSIPSQRTDKGVAYEKFVQNLKKIAASKDSAADWAQANAEVERLKMSPGVPHYDDMLTNMSVMYANDEYIGERCMPVVYTDGQLGGQYFEYDKRDRLAYPDDEVSSEGSVNELGQNRSRGSYALTPRALKEKVDILTIQNQTAPLNELIDAQGHVLDGLAFKREVRVAAAVATAANYSGNTVALAAADRWDTATGGDPGAVIDTAKGATWSGMGPGRWVLAMSLTVYNSLKRNPKILDSIKYGAMGIGPAFATRERLAEYFEVDEILVGKARKDTANVLQTAAYSRIWSDVCALIRVSTAPTLRNASFGYVLQDKPTQSDLMFDIKEGAKGAYIARSSRCDQEKVIAGTAGYLITTPVG